MKRFFEFAKFAVLMLLLIFLSAWVSGCGMLTEAGTMKLFDEGGNVIAVVTDAAVQRDIVYNVTHRNRDTEYGKMYKSSGIQVEFKEVTLADGSMAWLPQKLSIREQPRFQQNLETRPPDHRGWDTADKFGELLLKGFGIWQLTDFGKTAMGYSAPQYHGPYAANSYNTTSTQIPLQ